MAKPSRSRAARAEGMRNLGLRLGQLALTLDGSKQDTAFKGAELAYANATNIEKAQAVAVVHPVLDIADDSTARQLLAARRLRAIRCGNQVFLPTISDLAYVFPNVLARSSLFATFECASDKRTQFLEYKPIWVVRDKKMDVKLSYKGTELNGYDRKVYCAALDLYRNVPLAPAKTDGAPWQAISFFKFAAAIGSAYGAKVHIAIRDSLLRMGEGSVRAQLGRLNLSLPRMLEATFERTVEGEDHGSDLIYLRVTDEVAQFFGPGRWSAVNKEELNDARGVRPWLLTYLNTFKGVTQVPVSYLHQLSGSHGTVSEFRRSLENALKSLEAADASDYVRIGWYSFGDNGSVTIAPLGVPMPERIALARAEAASHAAAKDLLTA